MADVGLYALTVLLWGTTWIAVTLQTGTIAPEVSVSYRFALAGLLFLGYAALRQIRLLHSPADHAWMALQGFLLAVTFVCIYVATTRLASGLVAIVFSLVAVLNVIGMRLFFRTRMHARLLLGAALGVVGVLLIFGPNGREGTGPDDPVIGLPVSFAAALFAALAGMVIVRNQRRQIPMVPLNGFSLLYGAGLAAAYTLLLDKPFAVDWSPRYLGSLLYLSLVGSVLVFAAYLELIRRIGAERAGYVAVASPVVALLMSGAFEALRLDEISYVGLIACLAGNVLVLRGSAHPSNALR
jgi:drug/metabolite transporter (DMT)-like permease